MFRKSFAGPSACLLQNQETLLGCQDVICAPGTPNPISTAAPQVLRPFMLRRLKETVASELPQKREHLLPGGDTADPPCWGMACPLGSQYHPVDSGRLDRRASA